MKTRPNISIQMKMDIIKKCEEGKSLASVGREYNVNCSTIATILKEKQRIFEYARYTGHVESVVICRKRNRDLKKMEECLAMWIENQSRRKQRLSLALIKEKALSLFNDIQAISGENNYEFRASNNWFDNFKQRINMKKISSAEGCSIVNREAAEQFLQILSTLIQNEGYTEDQVFNLGETDLFWKVFPKYNLSQDTENADHLTLLLATNASVKFKLKPLIIHHSEMNVDEKNLPVIWKKVSDVWYKSRAVKEWFHNYFIPATEKYCAENGIPFKVLLLLDNSAVFSKIYSSNPNVRVMFFPSFTYSWLQPIDNTIFCNVKHHYIRKTISQAIETTAPDSNNLEQFWNNYTTLEAAFNISYSWEQVTPSLINPRWGKLYPKFVQTPVDDKNDFSLIRDVIHTAGTVKYKLKLNDINAFAESSVEISNNDLIQIQKENEVSFCNSDGFFQHNKIDQIASNNISDESLPIKEDDSSDKPEIFNVNQIDCEDALKQEIILEDTFSPFGKKRKLEII